MKLNLDDQELLELSTTDIQLLENDLLDVGDWIKAALIGKIESCWGRFRKDWMQILFDDPSVEAIPADREEFVALVVARSDYKNRKQREDFQNVSTGT